MINLPTWRVIARITPQCIKNSTNFSISYWTLYQTSTKRLGTTWTTGLIHRDY